MAMDKFVNLHTHSAYSTLDGLARVPDIIRKTKGFGQPATCVTDHGNMFGTFDLLTEAERQEQKAIVGFEAYVVRDRLVKGKKDANKATAAADKNEETDQLSSREHLILLAATNDGYKRLSKICSEGYMSGFYKRPRIDDRLLEEIGTEGILASSACLAGRLDRCILNDDLEGAERWTEYYARLFHDNFWLEIQPTEMPEQVKVNQGLMEIAKRKGLPMIATTDAHYLNAEDKATHDVLLCMQSNKTIHDEDRWTFTGNSYYIMSRDEILAAFQRNGHEVLDQRMVEQAVDETVHVAELCNVHLDLDKHYLPKIDAPVDDPRFIRWRRFVSGDHGDSELYLRYLCSIGLQRLGMASSTEVLDRLAYELSTIANMGFPDYFLIYEDIVRFCQREGIMIGPGRGCGVGDNLVATPTGRRRLDEVAVGDGVIAHDGIVHTVNAVHAYDVDEELVTLEVADGRRLTMTADHRVLAKHADEDGPPRWLRMDELTEGDLIVDVA